MAQDPFRTRQVPESVSKEFAARADSKKVLQWTGKRYPWIYALTCAGGACSERFNEFGNDPTARAGALKMFGKNQSLAGYEEGSNIPLPHIEELQVKAMGSLGTTRKATMKVKCYKDEHLIELQKCWFIPGMDVRVQWGWSESCSDEYGEMEPGYVLDDQNFGCERGAAAAICQINKKRKARPDYDGFQGIVTNFKYSLAKDNSWDVDIELISAADPFSDSKVGNESCGCPGTTNTDSGEVKKDYGPMYEFLSNCYDRGCSAAQEGINQCGEAFGWDSERAKHWCAYRFNYFGVERTETGGEKEGSFWDDWFDGEETIETWISLGLFVDLLNTYAIPHDPSAAKDNKFPYGSIDISGVLLPTITDLCMSSDPRKVYIEGFGDDGIGPYEWEEGGLRGKVGYGSHDAYVSAASLGKSGPKWGYCQLSRIMCNTIWLNQVYKSNYDGTGTLKGLIDSVLREINSLCGNPWEFTTIATTEDCGESNDDVPSGPTITLIDARTLEDISAPFEVPSTVGDSTLRDFSLTMKLTGAMKTQALYGNNQQRSSPPCSGTAVSPFYLQGKDEITNKAKPKPGTAKVNCGDCKEGERGGPSYWDIRSDWKYDEINDQTCGSAQQYVNKKMSEGKKSTAGCGGVSLPFDFSFTVDGIGGFEFGQKVTSTRIPEGVRKAHAWQITKVEHKVTRGDWETTISTVARANPQGTQQQFGQAQSS